MGILNDAVDLLAHPQTKTDSRLGEIMIDFRSIRNAVPDSAVAAALFSARRPEHGCDAARLVAGMTLVI
jgi:hypothetical protein